MSQGKLFLFITAILILFLKMFFIVTEMKIKEMILTFEEFLKVDIRVGTVQRSELYVQARQPAFKLWIYFGLEIGLKKTSAQITKHYTQENLVGRQVAAVINFPPKQIGKFMSEVLVLGFPDMQNEVVLLQPSIVVPDGGRLF